MRHTFAGLVKLSKDDPKAYRAAIQRLQCDDPERLDDYVEWFRLRLEKATRPRRRESILALFLGATSTTRPQSPR